MTDNNTLADYNIKDFGEPSKYVPGNHKVSSYSCFLKEQEKEYLTGFDNESITSCSDRICIECTNDHSFRGNFKDAVTSIDMLPEIFPALFKDGNASKCSAISKLQEFVN
jgi:hypothetical protein